MRFSFVQLRPFVQKWRSARLTDEDLQGVERRIIERPDAGDVMQGTAAAERRMAKALLDEIDLTLHKGPKP